MPFFSGVETTPLALGTYNFPYCKAVGLFSLAHSPSSLFCTASCPSSTLSHKAQPELSCEERGRMLERAHVLRAGVWPVQQKSKAGLQFGKMDLQPPPARIVVLAAFIPCRMVRVCRPYDLRDRSQERAQVIRQCVELQAQAWSNT